MSRRAFAGNCNSIGPVLKSCAARRRWRAVRPVVIAAVFMLLAPGLWGLSSARQSAMAASAALRIDAAGDDIDTADEGSASQPAAVAADPLSVITVDENGVRGIRIRGEFRPLWPTENLLQRGVPVRKVDDAQNAALIYCQAFDLIDIPSDALMWDAHEQAVSGVWIGGDGGARLEAYLKQSKPALDLIRQAAQMPEHVTPYFGTADQSVLSVLLPSLSEQRRVAKLLAAEATMLAHHGDVEGAIRNAITVQRLASQVGNGFTLIEYLVGLACSSLADRMIENNLQAGDLEPQVWRDLLAEHDAAVAQFPDWAQAMQGEMAWGQSMITEITDSPEALRTLVSNFDYLPEFIAGSDGWSKLYARLQKLYLPERTVKRQMREFYDRLLDAGQQAQRESRLTMNIDDDKVLEETIAPWNSAAYALLPSLSRSFQLSQARVANVERARLQLAIAAYKSEHGSAPRDLSQLVPGYIDRVPIDPVTSKPMRFAAAAPDGLTGLEVVDAEGKPLVVRDRERAAAAAAEQAGAAVQESAAAEAREAKPVELSEWGRHVAAFIERFELSESQATSAHGMLTELEKRAEDHRRRIATREAELMRQRSSTKDGKRIDAIDAELERLRAPIERLFVELNRRLETLPTSGQREAASKRQ